MKKKVLACTLAAVLSVSMLAGCGNDGNSGSSGSSSDAGSGAATAGRTPEAQTTAAAPK